MYTREQWINAMKAAVDERGDFFTYPEEWLNDTACQYVYHDRPACIVGLAASKLGVSIDTLNELGCSAVDSAVAARLGVPDYATLLALRESQIAQDDGDTWGTALEVFFDTLEKESRGVH